jgi:uncharacterized membrane protein YqgA involved in biofilm formation
MIGTWINIAAIVLGGLAGLAFGARLPLRLRQTVIASLGLFTAGIGLRMFLQTQEPILALGALALGAIIGEWWRIEDGITSLGAWLERRFAPSGKDVAPADPLATVGDGPTEGGRFVRGFLAASLLFCVGPMTILGSIQDAGTTLRDQVGADALRRWRSSRWVVAVRLYCCHGRLPAWTGPAVNRAMSRDVVRSG